jgi:hypothetical protein
MLCADEQRACLEVNFAEKREMKKKIKQGLLTDQGTWESGAIYNSVSTC